MGIIPGLGSRTGTGSVTGPVTHVENRRARDVPSPLRFWNRHCFCNLPAGVGSGDAIAGPAGDHRGIDADPLAEVLAVEVTGAEHAIEPCAELGAGNGPVWFHDAVRAVPHSAQYLADCSFRCLQAGQKFGNVSGSGCGRNCRNSDCCCWRIDSRR